MKHTRHSAYLNGKKYVWNDSYGDYIYAFTPRSGNSVVKRWREEVAKLNAEGAAQSVGDDVDRREAEKRLPLELMRSDEYDLARRMKDPSIINHEKLKESDELNETFDKRTRLEYTDGYEETWSCWGARRFLEDQFHIETDKSYYKIPLSVANNLNCELVRFRNVFGTVGFIDKVVVDSPLLPAKADAGYDPNTRALLLRSDYREPPTRLNRPKFDANGFPIVYQRSTGSSRHVYRHEIAHALYHFVVRNDSDAEARATELHTLLFKGRNGRLSKGVLLLSEYAKDSEYEMFAEAVAQLMDNGARSDFACAVVKYVIFGGDINDFKKQSRT